MKKSRGEISKKILNVLESGVCSIQDISKRINSNWKTVNGVLEELKNKGRVREIVSTDKIRMFQLIRKDTYLNIPIEDRFREIGHQLYGEIRRQWINKTGKIPTNTEVLKTAVDVLEKRGLDKKIPTVWYLYGKIPVLKYSPTREYRKGKLNSGIKNQIKKSVKIYSIGNAGGARMKQYDSYKNELYKLKEKISNFIVDKNLNKNKERFKEKITELYSYCPSKNDASGVLEIVGNFSSVIYKICLIKNVNQYRKEILEVFNSVWGFIALYMFFDSLTNYREFNKREEIKEMYFGNSLYNKKMSTQELISNLHSIYLNNLNKINEPEELPKTEESEIIKNLFMEMSEEN